MKLRLGSVPFLNAKPLIEGMERVELSFALPSELAAQLEAGEIDAALVSSVELIRRPNLRLVTEVAIASDGPTKSVRLFSKMPLSNVRKVALDSGSLTSSLLTRIYFEQRIGIAPEFVSVPADLETMLELADAALMIGDAGMSASGDGLNAIDMGAVWRDWTGLPFVWAGWLAAPDAPFDEITEVCQSSKALGLSRLPEIAQREAVRLSLPFDQCLDYLTNAMKYDLGNRELEGLERFLTEAGRFARGTTA